MSSTTLERLAHAALFVTGGAVLHGAWAAMPASGQAGQLLLLQAAIGGALLLAPWVPAVRFAAILAGLLGAVAPLAVWTWSPSASRFPWTSAAELAVLLLAGAELLRQHRVEARWNGVLPSRQES